jgi:hypothetical protein
VRLVQPVYHTRVIYSTDSPTSELVQQPKVLEPHAFARQHAAKRGGRQQRLY